MSKQPTGTNAFFIPETPGGSVLMHLKARTENEAWAKLLKDAAHMPYKTKEGFIRRGYSVNRWEEKQ